MHPMQIRLPMAVLVFVVLCSHTLEAQSWSSGSTGEDGALELTSGTILFDPTDETLFGRRLDLDGDNVYHFTTITISSAVVRFSGEILGPRPLIWLASGPVTITSSSLDLQGKNGSSSPVPTAAGAGGYRGGRGSTAVAGAWPGSGPGAGQTTTGNGGAAGHAVAGQGDAGSGGGVYGNAFALPILGGSGGAGGHLEGNNALSGGGGGGAILIASSESIVISASHINVSGGAGGGAAGSTAGAGSGGSIRLRAPTVNTSGSLNALGGSPGATFAGGYGRIRIEARQFNLVSSIQPTPSVVTVPGPIAPPASWPSVRVVRVAGIDLPATPTASYLMPDVTVPAGTSDVDLDIVAANVPSGTVVQLTLYREDAPPVVLAPVTLAADLTATATTTLPLATSRFTVHATWTP